MVSAGPLDVAEMMHAVEHKRRQLGLSRAAVMREVCLSRSAYALLMSGDRQPTAQTFVRIMMWLGVYDIRAFQPGHRPSAVD